MTQPTFNVETARLLEKLSPLELDKLDHFVKFNGRRWRQKLIKHWASGAVILSETKDKIGADGLSRLAFPAEVYRKG